MLFCRKLTNIHITAVADQMSDLISPSKYPILATSLEHCTVCKDAHPINFEDWRGDDKLPLTVYGREGSYQVSFSFVFVYCAFNKSFQ